MQKTAVVAGVAVVVAVLIGFLAGGAMAGGDEGLPDKATPTTSKGAAKEIPAAPAGPKGPALKTGGSSSSSSSSSSGGDTGSGSARRRFGCRQRFGLRLGLGLWRRFQHATTATTAARILRRRGLQHPAATAPAATAATGERRRRLHDRLTRAGPPAAPYAGAGKRPRVSLCRSRSRCSRC